MKILIIIPVYNEEEALGSVLEQLHASYPLYDLLVVNDSSTDHSGTIAESYPYVKVLHLPYNLGIGGCVQTGFKYAAARGYQIAVQFDGDGQHNTEDLKKLVAMIRVDQADVAIGSRFNLPGGKGFRSTGLRRLGIRIFHATSYLLIQQSITDHTSGFRAYNRKAIEFLSLYYPVDYPEPEVIIYLGRKGFRIRETFTQMRERQGGVSSIPLQKGPYYMIKVLLSMFMSALRAKSS